MSPTRRLARADVVREHTYEWLMDRADAETRPCETCRAQPGETCRNVHTGAPLALWPAHISRLQLTAPDPSAVPRPTVPGPRPPSSALAAA